MQLTKVWPVPLWTFRGRSRPITYHVPSPIGSSERFPSPSPAPSNHQLAKESHRPLVWTTPTCETAQQATGAGKQKLSRFCLNTDMSRGELHGCVFLERSDPHKWLRCSFGSSFKTYQQRMPTQKGQTTGSCCKPDRVSQWIASI